VNILKIQNLKQGNQFYKFQRKGRILQKSKFKPTAKQISFNEDYSGGEFNLPAMQ
jgi:hypothetical protein